MFYRGTNELNIQGGKMSLQATHPRQNKIGILPKPKVTFWASVFYLVSFILIFGLAFQAETQFLRAEDNQAEDKQAKDNYGIGQFRVEPNPFNPGQGEVATIKGVAFHFSREAKISSPSLTVEVAGQVSLPVTVTLLDCELLTRDSLDQICEWSFEANWDGTDAGGELLLAGDYLYTINLDLPDIGKDTKSGKITISK